MWLGAADILEKQALLESVFFGGLQTPDPAGLVARVATEQNITTESVVLAWNDLIGTLNEWVGDRVAGNLKGRSVTLTPRHWEKSVKLNRDHFADDNLGLCRESMNGLSMTVNMDYRAKVAAELLYGFTRVGWDGKAIFANDHPYVRDGVAGTIDNLSALNVGATGLAAAISYFDNLVGPDGGRLYVQPDLLVCAPGQRADAEALLKAPTGAAGATNIDYQRLDLMIEPGFTDKYWMVLCTRGPVKPVRLVKRQMAQMAWTGLNPAEWQAQNDITAGVDARHDAIWTSYQFAWGSTGT